MCVKMAGHVCDRCKVVICGISEFPPEQVVSRMKKTKLDFCSEECRIIFFKGRKYMKMKNILKKENRKRAKQKEVLTRNSA